MYFNASWKKRASGVLGWKLRARDLAAIGAAAEC
jgi:hypothetical protein